MRLEHSGKDHYDSGEELSLRLLLYKNELFRLPPRARELRVLSGRAWVTVSEKDLFLSAGECITLSSQKAPALASPLDSTPLIMEIKG